MTARQFCARMLTPLPWPVRSLSNRAYIRNQDGVELRLEAPVRSDIAARASIRVQRTFEL